ncbi:unnamed protein product, partial [Rhizoctonia solani]
RADQLKRGCNRAWPKPSLWNGERLSPFKLLSRTMITIRWHVRNRPRTQSWTSLVDKSVVEGIPDDERKRQEAIFELIATESAYVRDLQMIVEKFYASMVPMLDEKSATVIFANVEDILLCNTTFLSSLEERQKDCRLYIDHIGDILNAHMNQMAVYMPYCVHQAPAIKVLQGLRKDNSELATHLQVRLGTFRQPGKSRPSSKRTEILHHTQAEAERAQISHAIHTTERILEGVNEAIREREGAERLGEISKGLYVGQGHLDLTAPTRYMGPRRLIKEGVLVKAKSGRRLHAVLCNDIVVLMDAAAQSLYRMPMALTELNVREGKDDQTLSIQVAYPRGGDTIVLRASSSREARSWIEALERARAEAGRWHAANSGRKSLGGR